MTAIYLCNVIGDGQTAASAFRPAITTAQPWSALMVHEAKAKALILAKDDAIADVGAVQLVAGATLADLRQTARTTNPSGARRTTINTWLTANGYLPLPAGTNWLQTIHHIARQVNPAADLDRTGVA